MHSCVPACVRAFIRAFMRACVDACMGGACVQQTYGVTVDLRCRYVGWRECYASESGCVCVCVHACVHACVRACLCACMHACIRVSGVTKGNGVQFIPVNLLHEEQYS